PTFLGEVVRHLFWSNAGIFSPIPSCSLLNIDAEMAGRNTESLKLNIGLVRGLLSRDGISALCEFSPRPPFCCLLLFYSLLRVRLSRFAKAVDREYVQSR